MLLKANGEALKEVATLELSIKAFEQKVATLKLVAGISVAAALAFFVRGSKL